MARRKPIIEEQVVEEVPSIVEENVSNLENVAENVANEEVQHSEETQQELPVQDIVTDVPVVEEQVVEKEELVKEEKVIAKASTSNEKSHGGAFKFINRMFK